LNEVDEDLLDLGSVSIDASWWVIFQDKLNSISRELGSEQILNFVKWKPDGDGCEGRLGGARELEEVTDDVFEANEFAFNELSIGVFGGACLKSLLLNEECGLDGGERGSDFMGDAGGEHAE
jgi:hypothetical protein